MTMDFQSAMETFAEAWVAANTKGTPLAEMATQSQALALTRTCKTPPPAASTPVVTGASSRDSTERTSTPVHQRSSTPVESVVSPPSVKEEFETKSGSAKSLPVHCIVEAIGSLEENRMLQQAPWRRRPLVETDSYVIIPVGTPFHNLVHAALLRLGYSSESAAAAKGSILIKNWKALSFDQITDDPLVTVGDILGELTTVATLRIQVFRGRPGTIADIKDKLLRYLLVQSHGLLVSAGCPLDELFLSQICRSNTSGPALEMSEEIRRKFDQWWTAQFSPQSPSRPQYGPPCTGTYPITVQAPKPIDRSVSEIGHPAMQTVHNQFPTQKTRMRTSFDPELELPKLQRWFADNQHPSRQQIQQYVKELNSLESRRGRKPLDINNVVYWFKNARAAQKRAEIRNIGPGLPCHLTMNGYSNHSPTNGSGFLMADGYLNSERISDQRLKNSLPHLVRRGVNLSQLSDDFSNAGSDLEDDDMMDVQPSSPIGPLSLTTGNRKADHSRASSPVHTALDIKAETTSTEPKEEPIDYHSPDDPSNNNKISDEDDDLEAFGDNKQSDGVNEESNPIRANIHRICGSPDAENQMLHHRNANDGLERLAASFPLVPNSMFSHSIMYMSQYIPGLSHTAASPPGASALNMSGLTADERRKRNRTFIDPVTEVPRLEQWFSVNTHPSHNLILKYTDELNCMAYRQKFPRLEPKNVQFWFKNRRAKCKRLKMSLFDNQNAAHYHHGDKE